jgi:hypothetical protein
MTNLIKDIEMINNTQSQMDLGIETEKNEHYDSVYAIVNDADMAQKIVGAIAKDHIVKENYPNYYTYLKAMEQQMRWDSGI